MPGLLVSVRDAREAADALAGGAALIDVKEPRAGALGRAAPDVLAAVLDVVASARPVSAALGELADWAPDHLPPHADRLAFVKWGLASPPADWPDRLADFSRLLRANSDCRVVAVAYADHRRAGAPAPFEVCRQAVRAGARVFMLDTWLKDGTRLVDWLSAPQAEDLHHHCRAAGLAFALAGSLSARDLAELAPLRPDWFAVRGAACRAGRREGPIDPDRVRLLAELVTRPTPAG